MSRWLVLSAACGSSHAKPDAAAIDAAADRASCTVPVTPDAQPASAAHGCIYATTAHATSYWDYSTGFRCCAAL